ncbi:uncharacterized protein B0T23DRAFT_314762 [Neurospora hispaniola]|uniref:Uncharacterized protein n=1 Tax=Neurospora hispaniola TaxID=588809 RepID=A0AAJ0I8U6_9PEZI|nr:hypothetical protein B0T23DRAFT_314762 [Neurospora hispaniola]
MQHYFMKQGFDDDRHPASPNLQIYLFFPFNIPRFSQLRVFKTSYVQLGTECRGCGPNEATPEAQFRTNGPSSRAIATLPGFTL